MSRYNAIIQEDVASIVQELATPLRVLSGTTLLVTGGGGFLCSYFLDTVAHWNDTSGLSPCRMVCLDNLASGLPQRLAHLTKRSDFRLVRYDVSQPLALNESITWIIHGASIASPIVYRRLPIETMEVNANGTRHLLDVARQRRSRSMLYLSSSEIYGDPTAEWVPTPETYRGNVSCIGPRACYDESKRMGETWCWVYFRQHGVPVKIVRPFNVYGPGQRL
ncbi:MAG: NAD-dependent epimerase/dehydratase family protein, partial [Candidatus Omnitrophica bacterium]|nr:NAD-dependent epimerase/dehydratase family protein [Candidatus Omnitrophota bacterium]